MEEWNARAVDPLEADELGTVVESSRRNRQNAIGAHASGASSAEAFGRSVAALAPEKRSRFYFEDEDEADQAEDAKWLIPGLLPDRCMALIVGAKGSFKSFYALELAMAIASGVPTCGQLPCRAGSVFYAAWESKNVLKKARRRAWKVAREVSGKVPVYFGSGPIITDAAAIQEFGDQIKARCKGQRPALIIIDTLAKTMANSGLDESKTLDAGQFVAFCESLVEAFGCTVLVLHHLGKDASRGARGASAIPAGFETVIGLELDKPSKALTVRVQYHKDAAEPDHPWTFEGREIAGSMVLFPTDREAHRTLTKPEELFPHRTIFEALQALGAISPTSVSSTVLASGLLGACPQHEAVEDFQARIDRTARVLAQLARPGGKLSGFGLRVGRSIMWSLPATPPPG
jgi:hypothetical protein